jgi:hypothetical protein
MPMIISPDSELGKELAKWDIPKSQGGMRCDGYEPYPKMLYKADRYPGSGKVMVAHPLAGTGDAVADAFSARCWRTVKSAEEHESAARVGWCDTPAEALAAFEKAARAEADAAANAAYQVKRMSEKSQREFDAAQDAAEFHDPEVKAPKLAPRQRNSKGQLLPKAAPTEPTEASE